MHNNSFTVDSQSNCQDFYYKRKLYSKVLKVLVQYMASTCLKHRLTLLMFSFEKFLYSIGYQNMEKYCLIRKLTTSIQANEVFKLIQAIACLVAFVWNKYTPIWCIHSDLHFIFSLFNFCYSSSW